VDALALGADEGRDEHRYASGSCKQALIRRFPNQISARISNDGERRELKHLSTCRKRN